ncbi:hypothetical protein [Acidipila rosea]|uniref:Nucleic acid binding protein n=1 Tax=Acidipila rosea TaxID=768535 RepID=A0A4R1LBT1_9BACT|nr:hypothetical protein [Acidipila rosea]MBW4043660.1 hypothetical protein [Acidobacteriota bacterium]TCK73959.1 hypothetical protein C7378_1579 [Acidipila rosea]
MRAMILCLFAALTVQPLAARKCYSTDEAADHSGKDVCIRAHVYDVVEMKDGTRFLDVCSPETPDEKCRFSIVSLGQDRKDVGELSQLRNQDIQIRGTIRPFRGRSEILLSNARQFKGGPEKFHANPALMKGFAPDDGKAPVNDPALHSHHHHGSFNSTGTSH